MAYHSKYLDQDEFVPYAPKGAGEQVNINHADCPAGCDRKRRLYIKRCDDGHTIVAFCHHCGSSGSYRESLSRYREAAKAGKLSRATKASHSYVSRGSSSGTGKSRYKMPKDTVREIDDWPIEAKLWVKQNGITDEEVKNNGICYSPTYRRVILPTFDSSGVGFFQMRRIYDSDPREQKYLSYNSDSSGILRMCSGGKSDVLVVCEDYLSSIKLARSYNSFALCGANLNSMGMLKIMKGRFNRVVIWMDDDNRDVKMKQLVLKNKIDVALPFAHIEVLHTDGIEPKHCTNEEIDEILEGL